MSATDHAHLYLLESHLPPLQPFMHSPDAQTPAPSANSDLVKGMRDAIFSFLHRCDIPYLESERDHHFYQRCCEEAIRRGYPMDGYSVGTYLYMGATMASISYPYLQEDERINIAFYTACAGYVDAVPSRTPNMEALYLFNERFMQKGRQEDRVLEAFADTLSRLAHHYNRVASNLVVTSTLNGVTATLLEIETRDMVLLREAQKYSEYYRLLSGYADAFAIFIFPPGLPLDTYIQALPEIAVFLNNVNDVLSFYKEELAGESINQVSILAACQDIPKIDALRQLSDAAAEAHERTVQILSRYPDACEAYRTFVGGFIAFHVAATERYRLDELELSVCQERFE
ncbi:terpenoid synthase [Leucogyrophana mollusca]|uniref:Terpenoid synthase n=1 Tax=Leucogyrophana mollusca TaxID=85980 RepID=A0ACB8BS51_9AGAM|nr:terpenoid synthase [Leucogyrophana mollusca]